jgi:CDP-diacylglycerol pyrophosphatase
MTAKSLERERFELERQKWAQEAEFRGRELLIKEQELAARAQEMRVKEEEGRKSRLWNPLVLAILGATLAAAGNAVVTVINGRDLRELERQKDNATVTLETMKAEAARVLELVKTADPDKAATNLQFLLDAGLLSDKVMTSSLKAYLAARMPGQGVALPSGGIGPSSPPPSHVLSQIVQRCSANATAKSSASPCAQVDAEAGFAILKDLVGPAHYLVIPTTRITGIEDPSLLAPNTANYWKAAWDGRRFVERSLNTVLSPDEIGMAVNPRIGASQDMLHIHIDCVRRDVKATLKEHASEITQDWTELKFALAGHQYRGVRVSGPDLNVDPFKLLASRIPSAKASMALQSLFVTGAPNAAGQYDFVILNGQFDFDSGASTYAEELLDHSCEGARPATRSRVRSAR